MTHSSTTARWPSPATRKQQIDEAMLTHLSWLDACAEVRHTYGEWRSARRGQRRPAQAAHVAALDCEELAAQQYREAVERMIHAAYRSYGRSLESEQPSLTRGSKRSGFAERTAEE